MGMLITGTLMTGGIASAAEDDKLSFDLDQIVVTASKIEQKEFNANANISVINRDKIEDNHYTDLAEALKDVPGITIQNYGSNGENYTSNTLKINGSANIVVLIDGMRANVNGSSYGKFFASEFGNMDMIERVEVLRGSASTLYGSDAQGGVINIITRKPEEGTTRTKVGMVGGSYGKEQYNIAHEGSANGFYWSVSGQKRRTSDFTDSVGNTIPESIDSTTYNIKLGKKFDKDTELILNYNKYNSDYTGPEGGNNKLIRTRKGTKTLDKLSLQLNSKFSKNLTNNFSFFRNTNYLNDNPEGVFGTNWVMDLETIGFSEQMTYLAGKNNTLIGGLDYYQDKINNYMTKSAYSTVHYGDKSLTNRGVYIQDEWRFTPEWNLTSGVRFDNHSVYGGHTTPSVVLGFNPSEKVNYYTSWKEYYVAPNQGQIYSPQYNMPAGNMNLEPETGKTIEAGLNYKFDDTFVGSFHIFKRDSKNVIAFQTIDPSAGMSTLSGQYYNIGEEHAKGFDIQLRKNFNKNLSANVGYTYTYIDPQTGKNSNQDGYVPLGAWNIGIDYTLSKFSADLNGRGVVNRDGRLAQASYNYLKTFWVWDLSLNYKVSKSINTFVKCSNIFDKFYTDQCYDLNPNNWYSAPGRNFQVGVEYSF
jgi:vitamin B12 transporter